MLTARTKKVIFSIVFFLSRSLLASWISPNRSKIMSNFYEKIILILLRLKNALWWCFETVTGSLGLLPKGVDFGLRLSSIFRKGKSS